MFPNRQGFRTRKAITVWQRLGGILITMDTRTSMLLMTQPPTTFTTITETAPSLRRELRWALRIAKMVVSKPAWESIFKTTTTKEGSTDSPPTAHLTQI